MNAEISTFISYIYTFLCTNYEFLVFCLQNMQRRKLIHQHVLPLCWSAVVMAWHRILLRPTKLFIYRWHCLARRHWSINVQRCMKPVGSQRFTSEKSGARVNIKFSTYKKKNEHFHLPSSTLWAQSWFTLISLKITFSTKPNIICSLCSPRLLFSSSMAPNIFKITRSPSVTNGFCRFWPSVSRPVKCKRRKFSIIIRKFKHPKIAAIDLKLEQCGFTIQRKQME